VVLAHSVLGTIELRRDGELLPVPAGKSTELLMRRWSCASRSGERLCELLVTARGR